MARTVDLLVRILGDSKGAEKAAKSAGKEIGAMQKGLGKAAVPAAAAATAIAGIAIVAGKAASDAQQSIGGVEAVYKQYASTVIRSSEGAAQSVGLSANAYRELAAGIGGQLKAAGVPMDQLAGKTDAMIRTASDLAATYGGTTKQAVEALGSALRGEADPAEAFNLQLSDSVVQAELAAKGQKGLTGQALVNAKAMARMALITKQSADATGMFASESDTAAGQQQRATAAYQDAAASIGKALLPAMTKMASVLSSVGKFAGDHPALFWAIAGAIGAVAAAILIANAAISIYTIVTTIAASATAMAWIAALWPILLVVAAIAAVVAIVVLLWKRCAAFRNAVTAIWNGIRAVISAVASAVSAAWARVWPVLSAGLRFIGALFRVQFAVISVIVRLAAALLGAVFRVAWGVVRAVAAPVIALMKAGFAAVRPIIVAVASALSGPLASAIRVVTSIARGIGSALSGGFQAALGIIHSITGAVESLISALGRIKVPKISLPKIPGLGKAAPPSTAAATGNRVAPLGVSGRGRASQQASSGAPTIVIQGAVDPEATARQIQRILDRHTHRVGLRGALRTS